MRRLSVLLILALSLALMVILVGCPQRVARPRAQSTTTTTAQPATSTTTTKETTVTLYYIKDFEQTMFLVPERRSIPRTAAIAKATLEELIKGPKQSGLTSVIPPQTKVLSVKITDSTATVDFSRDVLNANVGAEGESLGISQIVNTLTEFPTIKRVRFLVEGRDQGTIDGRNIQDWWGHVGLSSQPFSRNEGLIQGGKVVTNTIEVESPRAFTTVTSPLTVKGIATAFEATFNVRVLDKNDNKLAEEQIMATNFLRGSFEKQITFTKPTEPGRGTVLFFFFSPKDGSEVEMGRVTVFLK